MFEERMKKWLRKECWRVKMARRSHKYRYTFVRSRDSDNVGSGSSKRTAEKKHERAKSEILPVRFLNSGISLKGLKRASTQFL